MAKLTLLEIVQDILNDISGDFVNSIDDTEESQQVAQIVKSTYFAMMSNRNWPHLSKTVGLTAYGDSSYPVHMKTVEDIKELIFLNYNKIKVGETRLKYESVKWKDPDQFLYLINQRNNDASNVDVILDPSGIQLLVRNDKAPDFFTSFDDETLVFDSYDSAIDSTLQASKFQAKAYVMPAWVHDDAAIPDLPSEAFTALQEEAKSRSSMKLPKEPDQKAEQEATRQHRWLARKAWQVNGGIKYPNYGRKPRK
jgi:hypothetical protein